MKTLKLKKLFSIIITLFLIMTLSLGVKQTSIKVLAEEQKSEFMPINYVLTSGAGSKTKYSDIRTKIEYKNDKLIASGTSTNGGMGVAMTNAVDLSKKLSINVSLNSWQAKSSDRWFGFTLTDVLKSTDNYNEVDVYTKHSESWLNNYGAGVLFCVRPIENGKLTVQLNNIGLEASYDADGNISENAGNYNSGLLGWLTGVVTDIQLYNTDWTIKTDFENIEFSLEPIKDGNNVIGFAYEVNNGYYKRINWKPTADVISEDAKVSTENKTELTSKEKSNLFSDLVYDEIYATDTEVETALSTTGVTYGHYFYTSESSKYYKRACDLITVENSGVDPTIFEELDVNDDNYLTEAECENFMYGSAKETSLIKYANKRFVGNGDELYCLAQYVQKLKAEGKNLYLKYMYKDAFDIKEGTEPAKFTINAINGQSIKASDVSFTASKTITGDISATINEDSLHAGVYPSMIQSLKSVDIVEEDYKDALSKITAKVGENDYKVINVMGVLENDKTVKINGVDVEYALLDGQKIFRIGESELEEITIENGKAFFKINSYNEQFVITSNNVSVDGDTNRSGCSGQISSMETVAMSTILLISSLLFIKSRKED